ncbi:MAG TPA: hypothetical protein VGN13_06310 [Solirubrobacteraceae bacterium]
MSVRGVGALLTVTLAASITSVPAARADVFGSISLASEDPFQQADYAHDSAISGDGRYVAFDGSFGGATGVWRRDLQTGVVERVAGGDAERPSISADGRFISFTTTARLTPGDRNEGPDVYVRDMEVRSSQPCAAPAEGEPPRPCPFTLASAVDGGEEALSYAPSVEPAAYGSVASGRSALSADGRNVAFITTAVSDLLGPRPPQPPSTPAMQVAVRNLDTRSTRLVSVRAPASEESQPVSSLENSKPVGAVWSEGEVPPRFATIESYGRTPPAGASISADGSTVAWLGVNVGEQAALLPGEAPVPKYAEPLWRRIADGPAAPTRRITGGSDPLSPACIASGEQAVPQQGSAGDPCQGPFEAEVEPTAPGTWSGEREDNSVPQLSADGYTVAFLANAPLAAFGANFARNGNHSDVYVADMHAGLTRVQSLRALTELASGDSADLATNAPIVDLGISPDGTQIAFTTKRTVFPLGVPAYVSAPDAVPGMVELFSADLANETLTRVTRGFEGGASEHPHETKQTGEDPYTISTDGALSPSFSSNGDTLAFSSTADNLVYGDGNTPPPGHESATFDGSDAFVVSRILFASSTPEQYVSPPPAEPALTPTWRLFATALSRRDGTVVLHVTVPAPGTLLAAARGTLRVRVKARGRASRRPYRAIAATVATRRAGTPGAGTITIVLALARRYAALARRSGGLAATVSLVFSPSGHSALRDTVRVRFTRAAARTVKRRARRAPRQMVGHR